MQSITKNSYLFELVSYQKIKNVQYKRRGYVKLSAFIETRIVQ